MLDKENPYLTLTPQRNDTQLQSSYCALGTRLDSWHRDCVSSMERQPPRQETACSSIILARHRTHMSVLKQARKQCGNSFGNPH